jgi:hypothetical protein
MGDDDRFNLATLEILNDFKAEMLTMLAGGVLPLTFTETGIAQSV